MGDDIPLAILSQKPHMLYDYFKQRFAQVCYNLLSVGCMGYCVKLGDLGSLVSPGLGPFLLH